MNYLMSTELRSQNAAEFQTGWCRQGFADYVVT